MIQQFLASITLLLLCVVLTGCQSVPDARDQQRSQDFALRAQRLIEQGKFPQAVAELEEALKLDPDSPLLIQQMGRALVLDQKYADGEKLLRRALKLTPNDPATHGYLAAMYMNQKKYKEALESNLTAHKILPEDPYYFYEIARSYTHLNDLPNATKYYSMYLMQGEDVPSKRRIVKWMKSLNIEVPPFQSKVIELLEEKKFTAVDEYMQNAAKGKELDANGETELARAYSDIGNLQNARDILQEWQSKSPKSAFAKGMLGSAFIGFAWEARGTGFISTVNGSAQQNFEERLAQAKVHLEESRKIDPKNLHTVRALMVVAKARKSTWMEVKPLFEGATRPEPDNYLLQREMQDALAPKWGGSVSDMLGFARVQTTNSPSTAKTPLLIPMAHWEIAASYYYQNPSAYFGKKPVWDECKTALEAALARFPNSVEVRTLYLRTAFYAGAKAEARKQYDAIKDQLQMRYWTRGYPEMLQVKREIQNL